MRILIDGHNLIPKLPGLSLSEIDDEKRLIEKLQVYSREKRCQVDVFFDRAPTGFTGARRYGSVSAHFIHQSKTADDAIQAYLLQAGKSARNLAVVSSDHQVQAAARTAHATVISSEDFSRALASQEMASSEHNPAGKGAQSEDLAYWEAVFGGKNKTHI